jgi:predicted amino acid-binding ACT domain protein
LEDWYLEYHIHKDRPGLLGDIASLLGMLSINILTVSGVAEKTRCFLMRTSDRQKISALRSMLRKVENITVTALRQPTVLDRIALRHGVFIERESSENTKTYKFTRDQLGILVDFLGELLKKEGNQVIGIRGMPRVGKTESIVAASVYANRRWSFVSSTLLRQTVRTRLDEDEMFSDNMVFLLDGIVSTHRANDQHRSLVREIMRLNAPKVIEHPDIFVRETEFGWEHFDRIIELRNNPDEEISYQMIQTGFSSFDIS